MDTTRKFGTDKLHRVRVARMSKTAFAMAALAFMALAGRVSAEPGTTAGSFAVTPSGAASYTIPIWVPPGPRGVEPSIALNYNSQAGNGIMGVGWTLAGLSAIERCLKTAGQDGSDGTITLGATDEYCIGGKSCD